MNETKQKHIHFIGICGVAMSALAIAFQKNGWLVTGSDKGFYPPVSDNLRDAGIAFYPGWHPEKMIAHGAPELVVVGNVAGSNNPELLYVQEHGITNKSYPEVVAEFLIAPNSIVCAGTYGKSTTTTLMTWILEHAGKKMNYMFGGIALNNMEPAHIQENAKWSVVEGDEYKTSRTDTRAKFAYYSPTHLLLTSVSWDHADVYPTKESYVSAFVELVRCVPKNGVRVISEKALEVVGTRIDTINYISYGKDTKNDFVYSDVRETKNGLTFTITADGETHTVSTPVLGGYNADNITGCFALARAIGIEPQTIIKAVTEFKGMKRRLEKRLDADITVLDDIAHSPDKARAVLASLKKIYSGKIIGVFEPNTGNRRPQSASGYADAFTDADKIIIPRLTKLKTDPNDPDAPMEANDLAKLIPNSIYMDEDEKLVRYLADTADPGDVIVFLGSHSFRNMIEETVMQIKQKLA